MMIILSFMALITGGLEIRATYKGLQDQVYFFKPFTTYLMLLIALQTQEPPTTFYKYAIAAGLLFSIAGDILLMMPDDRFIEGLVSFLTAHLCYIVAFSVGIRFGTAWVGLLILGTYGAVVYSLLAPRLGKMKVPVIIYLLIILIMAWRATGRWVETGTQGALLALAGAALFVISDSALAFRRFKGRYRTADLLVMSTYYAAQWLIALSVSG
ncbi:MAG: lysoplasmalogenase [Anaerolineae bacterium]